MQPDGAASSLYSKLLNKMNSITTRLLLALFFISATFAVSLAQRKESRNVEDFDAISVRTNANVYLRQGGSYSLDIEGDRDDIEEVETRVRMGKLIIDDRRASSWFGWNRRGRVDIYITVKDLQEIRVSSSGRVMTESQFRMDDLELGVSGSGSIEIDANAKDIDIGISGSGRITLEGTSGDNRLSISGSGKLAAADMESESYDISISGSGSCRIYANKRIDADISGSGSVYYRGNPDKVRSDVSGSGRLRRL